MIPSHLPYGFELLLTAEGRASALGREVRDRLTDRPHLDLIDTLTGRYVDMSHDCDDPPSVWRPCNPSSAPRRLVGIRPDRKHHRFNSRLTRLDDVSHPQRSVSRGSSTDMTPTARSPPPNSDQEGALAPRRVPLP